METSSFYKKCFNSLAFPLPTAYVECMPPVALKAHFNGKQIVLDEPFDLPLNSRLILTVLSKEKSSEDAQWPGAAAHALASAYGDDEPDYSAAEIKQ
jgi:hypothetical protein